jgi:hypothetical protein
MRYPDRSLAIKRDRLHSITHNAAATSLVEESQFGEGLLSLTCASAPIRFLPLAGLNIATDQS